jgi:hypothetical protein
MTKVMLECQHCGTQFERRAPEAKRNADKGRKAYCSRSCVGHANISRNAMMTYGNWGSYDISQHAANRRDCYSDFRVYFRRALQRDKYIKMTLADLASKWGEQDGRCPYTGVELVHPTSGNNNPLNTASLDRKDSSIGYTWFNVQYVSMAANLAKHSMSHDQMIEFCHIVRDHWIDR